MLFQVMKNDKCVMSTTQECCIYDDDILKSMKSNSYTFKIDGKTATMKQVKSLRENAG